MKSHIGVDTNSELIHTMVGTATNINDVTLSSALIRSKEKVVLDEVAVYQDVAKRENSQDIEVNWHVEMRSNKSKSLDNSSPMVAALDQLEQAKAGIRSKIERTLRIFKRQFGQVKVH